MQLAWPGSTAESLKKLAKEDLETIAYENYYKVLDLYTDDYIKWFDKAVKNGIVKKAV